MLTLTGNAATEIRQIVDDPQVPDGAGLRIASEPGEAGLSLSLAAAPADEDQVVDDDGARVFLAPQAAQLLEGKSLDAHAGANGQVQFSVLDGPG